MDDAEGSEQTSPGILQEIFTSPLNLCLLGLCLFLLYKIFKGDTPVDLGEVEPPLPKLKKRDFTLSDLKPYDGLQDPRILMAVNGKVFDVTRGKKFYGPEKYDYIGKLLKPGDEPTEYTDDEEAKGDKKTD
ncbi:hypothetical protein CRUP_012792 [Coryphaenoides rupestris]|nr:hypothetical protein CRUP_012792 [Coryphaenoides rupestris]